MTTLLGEMKETNTALLGEMKEMNTAMKGMNKTLLKPSAVASGTYYERLDDVWEFELKECEGDFEESNFQPNGGCPEDIQAVWKAHSDSDAAKKSTNTMTPTRSNTKPRFNQGSSLSEEGSLHDSGVSSHSSNRGSRCESSSKASSTTARNDHNMAKAAQHVFGGTRKASIAHLFPPASPVCQEFYENMLACIYGPLDKMSENYRDRGTVMTFVKALSDCMQNKLALPDNHAPFYDEEMDQGTLILVPILKKRKALNWKKDDGYNVLVIADSSKTYRFCDMDHNKLPLTASKDDIEVASQFVTECIRSLGYSLANHEFEPLKCRDRTDRFKNVKKSQARETNFQAKVKAMETLKSLITDSGHKVLTPKLKMRISTDGRVDDDEVPLLLKIDFGDIPHFRCPHPMLLGFKAAVCLHKYAATSHFSVYQETSKVNVQEYVEQRGSMMLLPACGDPMEIHSCGTTVNDSDREEVGNSATDSPNTSEVFGPCVPTSVPLEITVPAEIPRVVSPER